MCADGFQTSKHVSSPEILGQQFLVCFLFWKHLRKFANKKNQLGGFFKHPGRDGHWRKSIDDKSLII
jgi:hypothetical protein